MKRRSASDLVEMPEPKLRDNDVLIQIHATGVNLLDSKIREAASSSLFCRIVCRSFWGNDVAGIVVQVGRRVRRFKVGDEVYARPPDDRIGTFAEFIADQ